MRITIKDKKIISTPKEPILINTYNTPFTIYGDIPSDSLVIISVEGLPFDVWEPAPFTYVSDSDNVFRGNLRFSETIVDYVNKHPNLEIGFTVKVNDYLLSGKIPFKFNYKQLALNGKVLTDNSHQELLAEIAKLNRKLDTYISKNHTDGIHIEDVQGLLPGMIPIVMDSTGHLKYDFPFSNLENTVLSLTELVNRLSELNQRNTERIGELETLIHTYQNQRVI